MTDDPELQAWERMSDELSAECGWMETEVRPDGLWLLYPAGEEVGPFASEADVGMFLDYLESLK
jgi:hypothetical protein